MPDVTLVAEAGRPTGSSAARRLRAAGKLPGVLYGHGTPAIPLSVDARQLRHALSGQAGTNQLLSLVVDGERHLAMARVLQRDPVRHKVIHVDFQIVRRDEPIRAEVPITLVGEAKAVEMERGIVEQPLSSLTIRAVPGDIPHSIEVDVSDLAVGDVLRVKDLALPPRVDVEVDPEEPVVIAASSAAAAALEEEAAAEEAAAGEGAAERRATGEGGPQGGEAAGEG